MEAVMARPFLDKRMLKSGIVLSATVNFVGTDKIRQVNHEFRDTNKVTDVLTFPLLDMKAGKLFSGLTDADFVLHNEVKELPPVIF
jgi:ssRNA-specific RNase YbeY (16S rRNA maturation enzyme)